MERKEVIEFLDSQFKKLKEEEHVEDLMKHGRVNELKQLAEELDFSRLHEFCKKKDLNLQIDEISEEHFYEMIFYFIYCGYDDDKIFEDYNDIIALARKKEEEMAIEIADFMEMSDLMELPIEKLINRRWDARTREQKPTVCYIAVGFLNIY